MPVLKNETDSFKGQEYLKIYPTIDLAHAEKSDKETLWAQRTPDTYASFAAWKKDPNSIK